MDSELYTYIHIYGKSLTEFLMIRLMLIIQKKHIYNKIKTYGVQIKICAEGPWIREEKQSEEEND